MQTGRTSSGALAANLSCFTAMLMWSVGFPAAEVLLQSWGTVSLVLLRQFLAVCALVVFWILADGWRQVRNAPWWRGLGVGSIGFGAGAILLLVGQKWSDAVTPAIAVAMMPVAGAAIEVVLDGRQLRPRLLTGIVLALVGGYLATGVKLDEGSFGHGAALCLLAVLLFAWGTRATTRSFPGLTPLGQTTVTLVGGMLFMVLVYLGFVAAGAPAARIGLLDANHVGLLAVFALVSLAIPQLMWIRGAGRLGILLASFHMNAVPFYVMALTVVLLGEPWNWLQAAGAALVGAGVVISQWAGPGARAQPGDD